MRTLPTNHKVIAAFVNQSLPKARNPRNSVWFEGNKLYSYQSHLATITPDRVLFINYDLMHYSNTTTAHISNLRTTAYDLRTFIVPLDLSESAVLFWYWDQVHELIAKHKRSITRKAMYREQIILTLSTIEAYVDYTEISRTSPEYICKHDITAQLFKHQIL